MPAQIQRKQSVTVQHNFCAVVEKHNNVISDFSWTNENTPPGAPFKRSLSGGFVGSTKSLGGAPHDRYNPSAEDLGMSAQGDKAAYEDMRDLSWSRAEKAIARKAFDAAVARELKTVITETKSMASKLKQPTELWELERYLGERRKEIDRKYDYRYSVLPEVFAILIREGRLDEKELCGLGEDELAHIRRMATL
jgi:hypothetical protein